MGFPQCMQQCHSLQYHKYYLLFLNPDHHRFIERCLRNHYIKFGGENNPQSPKKLQFCTPPSVKLVAILSISWEFPLIHVAVPFSSVSQVLFIIILESKPPYLCRGCLRNHYIKFGGEPPPPRAEKMVIFCMPHLSN